MERVLFTCWIYLTVLKLNSSTSNGVLHLNVLNLSNALFTLFFYFLISRFTPPEVLNAVSIFFVSYSIYSVVSAFSLNMSTLAKISQSYDSGEKQRITYVRSAVNITTFSSLLPAIFIFLVGFLLYSNLSYTLPIVLGILSGGVSNYSRIFLVNKYSIFNKISTILAFFFVFSFPRILSLLLYFWLKIHYGIEIGFLLGYIISVVVLFPRGLLNGNKENLKEPFSRSLPLYILSLIGLGQEWLGTISIIFLTSGGYLIGRYYILNALNIFLVSICTQVFLAIYPVLAKKGILNHNRDTVDISRMINRLVITILISLVIYISVESGNISEILFGSSTFFLQMSLVFLSISTLLATFGGLYVNSYGLFTYFLISGQKFRVIYLAGGASLVTFVISMFVLTMTFGIIGIPLAFLMMNLVSFLIVKKGLGVQSQRNNTITYRLLIYSILLFLLLFFSRFETSTLGIYLSILVSTLAFIIAGFILLLIVKPVTLSELKIILRTIGS